MALTDLEILRDLDRHIAELHRSQDRLFHVLQKEFHLFRQESQFHRESILSRIDGLEAEITRLKETQRPSRPLFWLDVLRDWPWLKSALVLALVASQMPVKDAILAVFK